MLIQQNRDRGLPLLTGLDKPVQIAAMSATTSEILNLAAIAAYDINR